MIQVGDCVEVMRELEEASVDAVVTDPPYGLEFMGKEWDNIGRNVGPGGKRRDRDTAIAPRDQGWQPGSIYGVPAKNPRCEKCGRLRFDHEGRRCSCDLPAFNARASEYGSAMTAWHFLWTREAFRVLKPGGHLLAFGGTRTYHRLACAIEDAGFEIRDTVAWLYGSGFPKSLDVSKAIDKASGEDVTDDARWRPEPHPITGAYKTASGNSQQIGQAQPGLRHVYEPATDEARRWQGWGTALKPAHEPIVVARKPLIGTVAANVSEHGTGALNVDGCRIGYSDEGDQASAKPGGKATAKSGALAGGMQNENERREFQADNTKGRWPANVVLDEEAAAMLDEQTEPSQSGQPRSERGRGGIWKPSADGIPVGPQNGDFGGASRFFYVAKASRAERNAGLEGFEEKIAGGMSGRQDGTLDGGIVRARNVHPTVKPVSLMRWLVRLVTPPDGLVLDPFVGSGTTGIAAALEGFRFLGIEREEDYAAIARARIAWWAEHGEDALRIVAERERAENERAEIAERGQLDLFAGS